MGSSNKKNGISPLKKDNSFEVTNNYQGQTQEPVYQDDMYADNNADNEVNTPAKQESKKRRSFEKAGSMSLDKKNMGNTNDFIVNTQFEDRTPKVISHGLNDGVNVAPVAKSGLNFDSMASQKDTYLQGMGAQKEIKNNMTSGHGYTSAYIPTGSIKPAGNFNLSNYLGTHKKLFAHKHDRNLQIGLNENF